MGYSIALRSGCYSASKRVGAQETQAETDKDAYGRSQIRSRRIVFEPPLDCANESRARLAGLISPFGQDEKVDICKHAGSEDGDQDHLAPAKRLGAHEAVPEYQARREDRYRQCEET